MKHSWGFTSGPFEVIGIQYAALQVKTRPGRSGGMPDARPFGGMQTTEFKAEGLRQALRRLWRTRAADDTKEASFALFEALNWLHSFQDRQLDDIAASGTRERELLLGAIGARNAMHHAGFDPVEWRAEGLRYPLDASAYPIVDRGEGYLDWWWRAALPPIERQDQRAAYCAQLEGKMVRHTLMAISECCEAFLRRRAAANPSGAPP